MEKKLNLGCGGDTKKGFLNVDIVKYPGVNKIMNIDKFPWSLESNSFDYVLCSHILEYVKDFRKTIVEIHRICNNGALIEIFAPYFMSTKYFGEPDHKIPFSYRTFDNYTSPRRVTFYNKWRLKSRTDYGEGFLFKTIDKKYIFDRNPFIAWIGFFHNLFPLFYERFVPAFLPPMEVYFKLQVKK